MGPVETILEFWFESLDDNFYIHQNVPSVKKWFTKDDRFDAVVRQKFEPDYLNAREGKYKSWEDNARGRLALILLLDQFSRNMYRNTALMFETDPLALELSLRSVQEKLDGQLQMVERLFLYMPLMHCEKIDGQKLSLQYFEYLVDESRMKTPRNTPYFEYSFRFAQRHHDIIERFGRFPHRNSLLKRKSTQGELEFLGMPGSSF